MIYSSQKLIVSLLFPVHLFIIFSSFLFCLPLNLFASSHTTRSWTAWGTLTKMRWPPPSRCDSQLRRLRRSGGVKAQLHKRERNTSCFGAFHPSATTRAACDVASEGGCHAAHSQNELSQYSLTGILFFLFQRRAVDLFFKEFILKTTLASYCFMNKYWDLPAGLSVKSRWDFLKIFWNNPWEEFDSSPSVTSLYSFKCSEKTSWVHLSAFKQHQSTSINQSTFICTRLVL